MLLLAARGAAFWRGAARTTPRCRVVAARTAPRSRVLARAATATTGADALPRLRAELADAAAAATALRPDATAVSGWSSAAVDLEAQSAAPEFWDDAAAAQSALSELAVLDQSPKSSGAFFLYASRMLLNTSSKFGPGRTRRSSFDRSLRTKSALE